MTINLPVTFFYLVPNALIWIDSPPFERNNKDVPDFELKECLCQKTTWKRKLKEFVNSIWHLDIFIHSFSRFIWIVLALFLNPAYWTAISCTFLRHELTIHFYQFSLIFFLNNPIMILPCHHISLIPIFVSLRSTNKLYFTYKVYIVYLILFNPIAETCLKFISFLCSTFRWMAELHRWHSSSFSYFRLDSLLCKYCCHLLWTLSYPWLIL